jgi:hypothetical protein
MVVLKMIGLLLSSKETAGGDGEVIETVEGNYDRVAPLQFS